MQQFLLLHVFGAVGVEVHFCLLIVQTGEVTDVVTFFYDSQALFRQRYRITEILQADFLLNIVVIFGCQIGYQVFDGDTGIGFSL